MKHDTRRLILIILCATVLIGICSADIPVGVVIGDSISIMQCPGRMDGKTNFNLDLVPAAYGWELQNNYSSVEMKWYAQGICGESTTEMYDRFPRDAIGNIIDIGDGKPLKTLPKKPSIIILDAGTAAMGKESDEVIESNIYKMTKLASDNGIYIIVVNLIAFHPSYGKESNITRINSWERTNLTNISTYVRTFDAHELMTDENNLLKSNYWLIGDDGEHMNTSAYVILCKKLYSENSDILPPIDYSNQKQSNVFQAEWSSTTLSKVGLMQVIQYHAFMDNMNYSWDFGNGATSTVRNPLVRYTTKGQYSVTLRIWNSTHSVSTSIKNHINVNAGEMIL